MNAFSALHPSLVLEALKALFKQEVTIQSDSIPYVYNNVPPKKLLNWLKVETGIHLNSMRPWGFPTHVQLEVTTKCNLRCALCPVSHGLKRDTGHMDFGLFKSILDDMGAYLFLIMMWDWGEPFVHPHCYEMISYAKSKNIKVVSSTNGHVFADPDHADRLVGSGLDSLIVAMDGITQETYEQYRRSGTLETVLEGIRNIVAARERTGSSTPLINLRFIPMRHNEHEIPELIELACRLGVDVLSLKTLNPCSDDMYNLARGDEESNQEMLPQDPALRRFDYQEADGHINRVRRVPPCKNPWNAPTIHWDGTVSPCTYDYDEMYPLGDLKKDALTTIWKKDAYALFRHRLRKSWPDIPLCGNCSYSFQGGSCLNETIAAVYYRQELAPLFAHIKHKAAVKPFPA